jgi:hypothetical protein
VIVEVEVGVVVGVRVVVLVGDAVAEMVGVSVGVEVGDTVEVGVNVGVIVAVQLGVLNGVGEDIAGRAGIGCSASLPVKKPVSVVEMIVFFLSFFFIADAVSPNATPFAPALSARSSKV